jgi:hypothetical protein
MALPLSRKVSARPAKRIARSSVKHIYRAFGSVLKLPPASDKDCVLVPFALAACIPQLAIRKFAAKEPFVVHLNENGLERLIPFFSDWHWEASLQGKDYQTSVLVVKG